MELTADDHISHHLPKVELHAHLNGCIPAPLLQELARERGVTLSSRYFRASAAAVAATAPHQLSAAATTTTTTPDFLSNLHPRSLRDCFDLFAELPAAVNDLSAVRRITWAALDGFGRDGVAYLELRSTPKRLLRRHSCKQNDHGPKNNNDSNLCTKLEYCQAILQVMGDFEARELQRYEQELLTQKNDCDDSCNSNSSKNKTTSVQLPRLPLVCRFLVSIDRSQSLQEAQENVDLAIALHSSSGGRVVGMDLGGDPARRDFRTFRPCLQRAREHGLKVTVHCGEIPCDGEGDDGDDGKSRAAFEEAEAVLDFGPDRLGHAVLLPPALLDRLDRLRIPVETCPTSNVMTLELHHQQQQQQNGIEHEKHGDLVHGLQQHPSLRRWLFPGGDDDDNDNNNNNDDNSENQSIGARHHPLAVGTDDPGVFDTTATRELWLLATAFHLNPRQLARIVADSVACAFCDAATRRLVQARVRERLRALSLLFPELDG